MTMRLVSFAVAMLFLNSAYVSSAERQEYIEPSQAMHPRKSPGLALGISVSTTIGLALASWAYAEVCPEGNPCWDFKQIGANILAFASLSIGPSAGHMYTGEWSRVAWMSLGRAGLVGLGMIFMSGMKDPHEGNDNSILELSVALASAGVLGLAIWDIVDAWSSANRINAKESRVTIGFKPLILPPASGSLDSGNAYGLALAGQF